jgi:hypothetical protein
MISMNFIGDLENIGQLGTSESKCMQKTLSFYGLPDEKNRKTSS